MQEVHDNMLISGIDALVPIYIPNLTNKTLLTKRKLTNYISVNTDYFIVLEDRSFL